MTTKVPQPAKLDPALARGPTLRPRPMPRGREQSVKGGWRARLMASREGAPDPADLAWLEAGCAMGWTCGPIPVDPFANAFKIGRDTAVFERDAHTGVLRPASPTPEQERQGVLIACHSSDDPKSPYKGRPLKILELERRSPGGSDNDERAVLTRAASQNLRRPDHAKLRTSYRAPKSLGGKRIYDRVSTAALWPIERHDDGKPLSRPNTHLEVLRDIADAQACLARRTPVLPLLVMMDALTKYGLTKAQCRVAFKPASRTGHD